MEKKPNPFAVMVHPHRFMKSSRGKAKTIHWYLAGIVGLNYLFNQSYFFSVGYTLPLWVVLLIDIVLAIPIGIVIFYLSAFLLQITGKIVRGKAKFHELYSAFAWSRVPVNFQILTWIGLMATYGVFAFSPEFTYVEHVPAHVYVLMIVYVVFFVWGVVILIHTVAEVQLISAWIAIWNVLFTYIVLWAINVLIEKVITMSIDWKLVAAKSLLNI